MSISMSSTSSQQKLHALRSQNLIDFISICLTSLRGKVKTICSCWEKTLESCLALDAAIFAPPSVHQPVMAVSSAACFWALSSVCFPYLSFPFPPLPTAMYVALFLVSILQRFRISSTKYTSTEVPATYRISELVDESRCDRSQLKTESTVKMRQCEVVRFSVSETLWSSLSLLLSTSATLSITCFRYILMVYKTWTQYDDLMINNLWTRRFNNQHAADKYNFRCTIPSFHSNN